MGKKVFEKKIFCASCEKPIHIKDFGLVENRGDGEKWYHNNFVCLVGLVLNYYQKPIKSS